MSRFVLSDQATLDLEEIHSYIAADNLRAADRLLDEILESLPLLATFPTMGRERPELASGLRSFVVRSYLVFYQPNDDGISVVRVLHGARDLEALFGA